jgi:hypothetical protein
MREGAMGQVQTKATELSVEDYLASIEPPTRQAEARDVAARMARLSGEPPRMWGASMVGFGRYRYRYDSGREGEMFRLGFAARKNALVLYVMDGFPRHADLLARLGRHTTGKSCLYLKKLSDVDAGVLEELIAASLIHMREKYPD